MSMSDFITYKRLVDYCSRLSQAVGFLDMNIKMCYNSEYKMQHMLQNELNKLELSGVERLNK